MIYSLPHNIASKLGLTTHWAGAGKSRRERRWQAELAEERGAHTQPLLMDWYFMKKD